VVSRSGLTVGQYPRVLEAFCDESGIHDGARACAVVGWVATTRTWQRFEERWFRACGGIEWHGKEFFGRARGKRVGPYTGWDDDKALAYVKRLVDAIVVSDLVAVGGVIDVRAFAQNPQTVRRRDVSRWHADLYLPDSF